MQMYNIKNWFWKIEGKSDVVYSTAARGYVPLTAPAYVSFLAGGNKAIKLPNEAELLFILEAGYPEGWKDFKFYVPVSTARQRLEAIGKWDDVCDILATMPSKMLKVLTLESGIDPEDADVLAILTQLEIDPAIILAP